jgi:hypothetical protein
MRQIVSRSRFAIAALTLPLMLLCALAVQAQPRQSDTVASSSAEQRTARYFESIRKSQPQELAFLLEMPKGGDLHTHLSGAIYAESYIQWAADSGLCINTTTMALTAPKPPAKCDPKSDQPPASMALTSSSLYARMIDAWSMHNWQLSGQSGHDHFFDTFGKFSAATWGQNGKMLAELVARAGRGKVLYVEVMLTPDGTTTGVMSSQIADNVPWNGNFSRMLASLKSAGIDGAATLGIKNIHDAEAEKDRLLKCGTTEADIGCAVTIRYIAQVSRGSGLSQVFAQMVTGFALANNPSSKFLALNLVQPEDGLGSMQNFDMQMQMLRFLRPMYPQAHLSLHAGELAPGMVTPEGLTFHIHDSVMMAGADRIGHGVDIMHESKPYELMKEMARRNVMVEICLSSNDGILGISGPEHPLATYMKYGVPVALATDDEGVSRSEISREFLRAADDQGLGYLQLKTMARNSLQYAFIAGGSLWSDARRFAPIAQCRQEFATMTLTSSSCRQYLDSNEKAKLQWILEEEFRRFEKAY